MPKKATAGGGAGATIDHCRRLAQGATTWRDFQTMLKGSGCSTEIKSQVWAEMKPSPPARGKKSVAAATTAAKKSQKRASSSAKKRAIAVSQTAAAKDDPNRYRVTLRLQPHDENDYVRDGALKKSLLASEHHARIAHIVKDSLYGFDVSNVVIKGDLATATIQANKHSVVYDEKTVVQALVHNYGDAAVDGWMSGDISITPEIELYLSLGAVDLLTPKSATISAAARKSAEKTKPIARKQTPAPKMVKAAAARGPKRAISKKPSRGCVAQTTKKYLSRNSPPFPANECCGEVKRGQGAHADTFYISVADKNGVCKWVVQK